MSSSGSAFNSAFNSVAQTAIGTFPIEGRAVRVSLHTAHDGVEFVGRLFFAEESWSNSGVPDRGVIPGRTSEDVAATARALSVEELRQRWLRANAEKRKYHALRRVTQEMLNKVRYMNRVAVGMRTGMLEAAAAHHELDLTESQLIALVRQVKDVAGIEG